MPTHSRPVLCALVAVLSLVAAPYAAADTADETALAERYAPVVRLVAQAQECGYGESYEPIDVDLLFGEQTVALRGPWGPGDLIKVAPTAEDVSRNLYEYHLDFPGNALDPGCDYERWANRLTEGEAPTVYAHVATEAGVPGRIALQYWFYYVFNDWNNTHEGDWENIQLIFDAVDARQALSREPVSVGYSQHEGSEEAAVGRGEARARRRDASGRAPGGRVACELLRLGALPRQLGRAGRRLRRHDGPAPRGPPGRADDSQRSGRGPHGVSVDRVRGSLG